jgi:hypothetical protein
LRNGGEESEDEDEDGDAKGTPKDDKMDVDEPGSLGRSTRCRLASWLAAFPFANKLLQHSAMRPRSAYSSNLKPRPARRASRPATKSPRRSTATAPVQQP